MDIPWSRTGGRAEAAVEFYGLGEDAEDKHEQELMLREVDRLLALADEQPNRSCMPAFRVLESMAEEITGSPDPYRLLMRYRQVRAAAPRQAIRSLDDLDLPPRAASPWSNFDVAEYVRRNYLGERQDGRWIPEEESWQPGQFRPRIIKHDREVIKAIYMFFAELGVRPGEFAGSIDIGSGGNLYPAMVLIPMIADDAVVIRQVYRGNPREVNYARVMHGHGDGVYHYRDRYEVKRSADTRAPWAAFAEVIADAGSTVYPDFSARFRGTNTAALARSDVIAGDIFDFAVSGDRPRRRFDVATSFFVHDSISFDPAIAWRAVDCIINAATRFVVIGQVLNKPINDTGSGAGYTAGDGTLFPNTAYSRDDWENYLADHPRVRQHRIAESRDKPNDRERFSAGEEGLALIVAELSSPA